MPLAITETFPRFVVLDRVRLVSAVGRFPAGTVGAIVWLGFGATVRLYGFRPDSEPNTTVDLPDRYLQLEPREVRQ